MVKAKTVANEDDGAQKKNSILINNSNHRKKRYREHYSRVASNLEGYLYRKHLNDSLPSSQGELTNPSIQNMIKLRKMFHHKTRGKSCCDSGQRNTYSALKPILPQY